MDDNIDTLLVELTQKCNLNCQYCFYRDYGRINDEINIQQFNQIIASYKNLKNIYFTGGECTLAKDFIDIVKLASQESNVTIFTNGVKLCDESFFYAVDKYISNYILTFDEFDENYFCRKMVSKTAEAINKILAYSPEKLIVKICINKYNYNNLESILEKLLKVGVKRISINFIHNIKNNNINFELEHDEIKKVFEILDSRKDYLYINFYDKIKAFYLDKSEILKNECKAGKTFLFYNCKYEMYLCPAYGNFQRNCLSKECTSIFEMY